MAASSFHSYCLARSELKVSLKEEEEGRAMRSGAMVVHVGSMPLRAPPGPARWALASADRFLSIQHFYTILQPISGSSPCTIFDFQPQNPEDLYTALYGLSGGVIPGIILERTIACLPTRRCWRVGVTKDCISMKDAVEFNRNWDMSLQLCKHDCRHHTDAFVEFLTGEKDILQTLKNTAHSKLIHEAFLSANCGCVVEENSSSYCLCRCGAGYEGIRWSSFSSDALVDVCAKWGAWNALVDRCSCCGVSVMDNLLHSLYPNVYTSEKDVKHDNYYKYDHQAFQLYTSCLYMLEGGYESNVLCRKCLDMYWTSRKLGTRRIDGK
ncbi:hypothetical protein GOP47_0018950 [Adiantum capillus-veneris]|uniref:Uncharacterized protein n=1 Tax=Adiantum capillus-veneris TaxID=13818 RepID=A0A9D4ZB67_ADICA|nr:hypothetical protein GOP47_0018950 [Adiantum capillus-veneris]